MAVNNQVSLQLSGALEVLNPTPSDPRKRVQNLTDIANSPVYFVGFDGIYSVDDNKWYSVTGGDAISGWNFTSLEEGVVSAENGLTATAGNVKLGAALTEPTTISSANFANTLTFDFEAGAHIIFDTQLGGQVTYNIDQSNGIVINNSVGTGVTLNSNHYTLAQAGTSITNTWNDGAGNTGLDFRSPTSNQTQVSDGTDTSDFTQSSTLFRFQGAKLQFDSVAQDDSNTKMLSINTATNEVEWVSKSTMGFYGSDGTINEPRTITINPSHYVYFKGEDSGGDTTSQLVITDGIINATTLKGGQSFLSSWDTASLSDYTQRALILAQSSLGASMQFFTADGAGTETGKREFLINSLGATYSDNSQGNGISYADAATYSNLTFTGSTYDDYLAPIALVRSHVTSATSTSSIQTNRPIKTIQGISLEGSGSVDLPDPTATTRGGIKATYDSATSTLEISIDGSNIS